MGILDNLFKSASAGQPNWKPNSMQEAYVAIYWIVANIDGELGDLETQRISETLTLKSYLRSMNAVDFLRDLNPILAKSNKSEMIDACIPFVPEDLRPTLFAGILDMVLIDGNLNEKEKEISEYIASKLGIQSELVSEIAKVIMIKNKGNIQT